jgi:hypothetical protein
LLGPALLENYPMSTETASHTWDCSEPLAGIRARLYNLHVISLSCELPFFLCGFVPLSCKHSYYGCLISKNVYWCNHPSVYCFQCCCFYYWIYTFLSKPVHVYHLKSGGPRRMVVQYIPASCGFILHLVVLHTVLKGHSKWATIVNHINV